MTWTAAIMDNDALDPDSLVGRMLNPQPVRPELMAEAQEFLDDYSDDFTALATVEPLPLWRVMEHAGTPRDAIAAEIEALRDWLLPDQPEPPSSPHMGSWVNNALWRQRDHLRARLTEQARIARGEYRIAPGEC